MGIESLLVAEGTGIPVLCLKQMLTHTNGHEQEKWAPGDPAESRAKAAEFCHPVSSRAQWPVHSEDAEVPLRSGLF